MFTLKINNLLPVGTNSLLLEKKRFPERAWCKVKERNKNVTKVVSLAKKAGKLKASSLLKFAFVIP